MPDPAPAQPSRPTIAIDGTESASLTGGLLSLRAYEDVNGLSNCEAEIGNWGPSGASSGYLYFDRRQLEFGKSLESSDRRHGGFQGANHRIRGAVSRGRRTVDCRSR